MLKLYVLFACLLAVYAASVPNAEEISPDAAANDVFFYLYNHISQHGTHEAGRAMNVHDERSFEDTGIDPSKPLVVLVHGFIQTHKCGFPQDIKDAYLHLDQDYNVVTVDWGVHSCSKHVGNEAAALICYPTAVLKTGPVGQTVSNFIWALQQRGLVNPDNVRIIGASMGAHVVGEAGSRYQKDHGQTISRITALDPGGPAATCGGARCLSKNDATFVDAVHTDMGTFGTNLAVGHVDYYPNGGAHPQPTCEGQKNECSHSTCVQFWLDSILRNDIRAYKCESYEQFTSGACGTDNSITFGENVGQGKSGAYYFNLVPISFSGRYNCLNL